MKIFYIETHIIDHCNLNCASCTHFSPLVKQPVFKDLEEFKREVNQLKLVCPELKDFRIIGGEPLLHPQFVDFCSYAAEVLSNTKIHLVTNGILLPQVLDQVKTLINKYNIELNVSNYGLNFKSINDLVALGLPRQNITLDKRLEMYNPCLDFSHKLPAELMYKRCVNNTHCTFLKDGFLYVCPILGNLDYYLNYFNLGVSFNKDTYAINIFSASQTEIELFLDHNYSGCEHCNSPYIPLNFHKFYQSKNTRDEWEIFI